MLVLKCDIEIFSHSENKKISFDYVNSVTVRTSCKSLSDTAEIVLPRKMLERLSGKPFANFLNNNKTSISEYLKRGDEVTIQLGYEGFEPRPVFKGYITHIEQGDQLIIKCEDKTFLLKQKVFPNTYKKFDFKEFFEHNKGIIGDIDFKDNSKQVFGNMNIIENLRVDQALDEVIRIYPNLRIFFIGDKLYITQSTEPVSKEPVIFSPERNIVDDSNLNYVDTKDLKLIITAKALANSEFVNIKNENGAQKTGEGEAVIPKYKKISSDYPEDKNEKEYEKRVFTVPESISEALAEKKKDKVDEKDVEDKLKEHAERIHKLFTTGHVSGSFTTFGEPFVQKGDLVEFRYGDLRPEIDGKVFIADAVNYSFNQNGYRQTITLGYRTK